MNSLVYRKKLANGMYSRIARALGIGRRHVSEVANGNRRSTRVEEAIAAEFAKIDKLVARFERKNAERAA